MVARFTGLTRPFNTLGVPALSLPVRLRCQRHADRPAQLVGRPFDEALLYRIGHAYQGATDHHRRVPTPTERDPSRRRANSADLPSVNGLARFAARRGSPSRSCAA